MSNLYKVTYEITVTQPLNPTNYGHLDGDITPKAMAESDLYDYENGGMTTEELFASVDTTEITVKKVEPVDA